MYIDITKANPGRISVNFRDIFNLKSALMDSPDGRHVQTFDLSKKRTLSCVNISGLNEHVFWAKLNGRTAVCPLIERERLPEKSRTTKITLVFSKKRGYVIVIAAYYGPLTPRFPDSYNPGSTERETAIEFWKTQALILGNNDKIELATKPEWA